MEVAYDWLGLNAAIFDVLQALHGGAASDAWVWLRHAYGVAALGAVLVALLLRYLRIRRTAAPAEIDRLGDTVFVLIGAAALMGCVVATLQGVVALPRPWESAALAVVAPQAAADGGFPAANAAIATLIAALLLPGAGRPAQIGLWSYAVMGVMTSVAAGWHFPADAVAGALIGLASVAVARWYLRYAVRLAGRA